MISVENLKKSFGGRVLFDGVSFKVNEKEKVGLVGRNGHGKTTLFRIIAGEESYDGGTVMIPKNYRVAYVRQQMDFTENTILEEGMKHLPALERDHHWKVEKVLVGLGFSDADFKRHPLEFSGGFQVRLNLAKEIVAEPDLLLLDEPTNYLDIASIRWLEQFFQSWPREVMLITHDRSFMDRIVTHVVGIHRRFVRKIEGDTGKFYAQMAQEEAVYEKTRLNDERRRKEIEQFITRFRAKARLANLVQSRIKTLQKMEKKERLNRIKSLEFSFRSRPIRVRSLVKGRGLGFSYDQNHRVIDGFSIDIQNGDRIGVIGKNGKGKTTLLKLLSGTLPPDFGMLTVHADVRMGIYEQTHVAHLAQNRTVEEEILSAFPDMGRQAARNICGAMMFTGGEALKRISVLSGGEKSRVMLGRILAAPVNLLLLDEPTNHLDMDACDALLAAIDDFDGTVVMVTHNEMFLHALTNRLIVFKDDGIHCFEGGYGHFLEKDGWEEAGGAAGHTDADDRGKTIEKRSKKALRQKRSDVMRDRGRRLKPVEERIETVESAIGKHETALKTFNDRMVAASQSGDGGGIADIARGIHQSQEAIDALFGELETLYQERERINADFERRLKAIDGA